jgi:hypothetical protein
MDHVSLGRLIGRLGKGGKKRECPVLVTGRKVLSDFAYCLLQGQFPGAIEAAPSFTLP